MEELWNDSKIINVYLIGLGLIGSSLLDQIKFQRDRLKIEQNVDVRVLAIANSKKIFWKEGGIDLDNWRAEFVDAFEKTDLAGFVERAELLQVDDVFAFSEGVLVDCTASEDVADIYYSALEAELHVVAPNKKAASGDMDYFNDLKEMARDMGVKYLYETNVGAGLPVISALQDLVNTGDAVKKIEAILSGTLSYIFNDFKSGDKFSDVVRRAKEKGYTEPDPRDDLNGMDVARKILILAREMGFELELEDVEVESLVSNAALNVKSVDEFFVKLEEGDDDFTRKLDVAEEKGEKLRYIAKFENGKASVKLESVGKGHPFYVMAGSDNIVSFATERYNETPLVIKGPGAGAEVTAAGVFADILRVVV